MKAGEQPWLMGHYLPVNWVSFFWELLEGRLVFSQIHIKHPVEQHPENWASAPGMQWPWEAFRWLSYTETPHSPEDPCPVTTPAEANLQRY